MAGSLYIAYFTGLAGNSMGLFYIGKGVITGIDAGGLKYDGTYQVNPLDKSLEGVVEFVVDPGNSLITGQSAGTEPVRISTQIKLPPGFADGRIVRLETPAGPVNAKFEHAREVPDA